MSELLFQGERVRATRLPRGGAQLELNRPELRNAFDGAMIAELTEALQQLSRLPAAELRALLLTGMGKAFCAGADLAYMQAQAGQGMDANLADARALAAMFRALAAFHAPVVCGVQGAAIGGGFGLAACADLVVAERGAVFALTEVRLGLVPAVISPFVVRKIGLSHAAPLMLSGRRITAEAAASIGLVHRLVEPGGLGEALDQALGELLEAGPEAARRTKALLLREVPLPDAELSETTARAIAEARATDEAKAGLEAFFAKTPAPWGLP